MVKLSDYELSVSVINEFALSGKPFTLTSIEEEIIRRGGILRVGICIPVREYFYDLLSQGYFQKVGDTKGQKIESLYSPSELFLLLAELVPHCIARGLKLDTYVAVLELGFICNQEKKVNKDYQTLKFRDLDLHNQVFFITKTPSKSRVFFYFLVFLT